MMKIRSVVLLTLLSTTFAGPADWKLAKRSLSATHEHRRQLFTKRGGLQDKKEDTAVCDRQLISCLNDQSCNDCFFTMTSKDIDWTGVSENTECSKVVTTLKDDAGICKDLSGSSQDLFCETFHACVYFTGGSSKKMDCDSLSECKWDGMNEGFLGDGICHDGFADGCYNHKICDYDKGDCCKGSCSVPPSSYVQCGSEGYACRDPKEDDCDPELNVFCPPNKRGADSKDDGGNDLDMECTPDESMYKIHMSDSLGDGWEKTKMVIHKKSDSSKPIWEGSLKEGKEGVAYVCLSAEASCYTVDVSGGVWGKEASWYIQSVNGGNFLASGGGYIDCEFPVMGGRDCKQTCTGKPNKDPTKDKDYKDVKTMAKCIKEKCPIQNSACQRDSTCTSCFKEEIPDYCFGSRTFVDLSTCTLCQCSDTDREEFCEKKPESNVVPDKRGADKDSELKKCTPGETQQGVGALVRFNKCMEGFDQTSLLTNAFDQNHFGEIDKFEACSHAFSDKENNGGHTGLGCLKLLVKAMDPAESANEDEGTITTITQLATSLYKHGEKFCDCTKVASNKCPLCPSFYNFKTLLYESLDACKALDEIDCDAWNEYQTPCRERMLEKFSSIRFDDKKKEKCEFVQQGCGSSDPFPAFRRLDCQTELSEAAWDFYKDYARACEIESPAAPDTGKSPTPSPVASQTNKRTPAPIPHHAITPNDIKPKPNYKPSYESSEDSKGSKPTYKSDDEKSHWFRNSVLLCLFGGIAYFVYKKRTSEFNFVRYRRMRNWRGSSMGEGDMYSGLSMESSTNFQPPSLPPTPMSMSNNGGYGM